MLKSLHTDQNAEFLAMLRQHRRQRRLRQSDLARVLGKSQATVSKVEQGMRRLDLMELRQWLTALDVDFLDFMNELSSRLTSALGAQSIGPTLQDALRGNHPETTSPSDCAEVEPRQPQ